MGDRHHVHVGVVELDPGELVSVRREVHGLGVREDLLLVDPVGDAVEDDPGTAGGGHHRVLALGGLSVVDVGPEDVGHAGAHWAPHGKLQGQLGRRLARRERRRSSRTSSSQGGDELVQVGLELDAAAGGDVVDVVLGQETVSEQPLGPEGQHHVLLVGGELEPEDPGVPHHVPGHDDTAGTAGSGDHHQALVHVPVDVLRVADPGPIPGLGTVVIILKARVSGGKLWDGLTKISCKLNGVLKLFLENCGFLFPRLAGRFS